MAKTVTATLTGEGTYHTRLKAANHTFYSDEPIDLGGSDKAIDPMIMLLGSLASCTIITCKMYLDRKNWEFRDFKVDVTTSVERVENAAILTDEERKRVNNGRLRRIHKHISIGGDLDEQQLEKVKEIAGKCPVNLLLKSSCYITDDIVLSS